MSRPPNESVSSSRSVKNEKDASATKKDASTTKNDASYNQSNFTRQTNAVKDLFSIPKPVKKLFDKVPIITYPANGLPQRSPGAKNSKNDRDARLPSLYIFCREGEEDEGKPSFNPGCLKWQVCLPV